MFDKFFVFTWSHMEILQAWCMKIYWRVVSYFLSQHGKTRYSLLQVFAIMTQWIQFFKNKLKCLCCWWFQKRFPSSGAYWTRYLILFIAIFVKRAYNFISLFSCCYIKVLKFNITKVWVDDNVIPRTILGPMSKILVEFMWWFLWYWTTNQVQNSERQPILQR